jgi:hypothetical protein
MIEHGADFGQTLKFMLDYDWENKLKDRLKAYREDITGEPADEAAAHRKNMQEMRGKIDDLTGEVATLRTQLNAAAAPQQPAPDAAPHTAEQAPKAPKHPYPTAL